MKTKAIEIGLVIGGLFLLALFMVGCDEEVEAKAKKPEPLPVIPMLQMMEMQAKATHDSTVKRKILEERIGWRLDNLEARIAALEARPVFDPNKCILRYKLDDFDLHPIYDPNMAVINLCSEAKDPNEYDIGLFSAWTAEGQRLAEKEPSMREFLCPCGRKYKSAGISHNIYELRNNYWVPILDQNE